MDGFTPFPKTSGSKGLQLYCAIRSRRPEATAEHAPSLAERPSTGARRRGDLGDLFAALPETQAPLPRRRRESAFPEASLPQRLRARATACRTSATRSPHYPRRNPALSRRWRESASPTPRYRSASGAATHPAVVSSRFASDAACVVSSAAVTQSLTTWTVKPRSVA